jgi:hypothetical protein
MEHGAQGTCSEGGIPTFRREGTEFRERNILKFKVRSGSPKSEDRG